jgi:hypothetical protein
MRRSPSVVLLLLLGCGGRDPLLGADDQGALPGTTGGGSGGGASTGGTSGTVPPIIMPTPPGRVDAGMAVPPAQPRDASPPPPPIKLDAAPPSAGGCAFPKCLADLMSTCTPTGRCVQQRVMGGGGIATNFCYDNGIKLITSVAGNGRNPMVAIRVMRADGTGCYTVQPESRGSGVTGLNYLAPSGQVVAIGTLERNRLTINCTGQPPQVVDVACQPGLMTTGCTNGTCQ